MSAAAGSTHAIDANDALRVGRFDPANVTPIDGEAAALWVRETLTAEDLAVLPSPRVHLLEHVDAVGTPYGILPRGIAAILAAAGDTGKSQILIALALCVATGLPWLGFNVASSGLVLIVLAEEDFEEAKRRFYYNAKALGLNAEMIGRAVSRIHLFAMAGKCVSLVRPSLPDDTGLPLTQAARDLHNYLEAHAGEDGWAALILDPLSRFSGPETETSNSEATRFVQALEWLGQVPGSPSVICSSHTSQASRNGDSGGERTDAARTTATRGVTGLTDAVRWVATIEPFSRVEGAPEISVLRITKSNYARKPPETHMVAQPEFFGARRPATAADIAAHEAARSGSEYRAKTDKRANEREGFQTQVLRIVGDAQKPVSTEKVRLALGKNREYVRDLLHDLEAGGFIVSAGAGPAQGWILTQPATPPVPSPDPAHPARTTPPATPPPAPYVVGAEGGGVGSRAGSGNRSTQRSSL